MDTDGASLRALALSATVHCLTGCAIDEVLGMVIGTALGWADPLTIALSIALAFVFGYGLTLRPLLASGVALVQAARPALAADTVSIAVMEVVDNGVVLAVPGAMDAGLGAPLFRGALAFALAVAFVAAFPVNYWLIKRGRGHTVVHRHHGQKRTAEEPTPHPSVILPAMTNSPILYTASGRNESPRSSSPPRSCRSCCSRRWRASSSTASAARACCLPPT